jgi:hypothetical protein
MKQHVWAAAFAAVMGLTACSSMGSLGSAASAFEKLGGSQSVTTMASDLVSSTIKDPRLAGLTSGKAVDPAASSTQVSNQLCSMLGGGCKAPLSDQQIAAAGSKVTPDQSKAVSDNLSTTLAKVASDPQVRELVTKAVGSKLPGVLSALL